MVTMRALVGVAGIIVLAAVAVVLGLAPALIHARNSGFSVEAVRGFFLVFVLVGLGVTFLQTKRGGGSTLRAFAEVCITLVTSVAVAVLALFVAVWVASL